MKLVLVLILTAVAAIGAEGKATEGSQLYFVQHGSTDSDGRNLGKGSAWGSFREETTDEYCLERRKNKGKLNICQDNRISQLWRFTENGTGLYDYGGFLQSKADKKCLQVRGAIRPGAKVKVATCRKNFSNQQWLCDGDVLSPRDDTKLCLYHEGNTIYKWDAAVLLKCEDTFSFNFGRA